ncbi:MULTISPECIES: hypothetical protein [unclassified Pseudoalteromonas]|uniref:hypothetical protein n=1 Tax=unclassified Pseudoalteromonas TaxID=194690 RepID=UPI0013FD2799|nr:MULTISPECIES: hypothetical protein [unclassified Pseudoalteromonas]MBH0050975.1 hypothetical protein [Pseudoalteromonas sp. SWYJZ19]MBH0076017.1 hypothetical protein [Pseudoalteromonas sp. SWYJ118]
MKKTDKFREWLSLENAAARISKEINENITVNDLYRLALDGHLKLSMYFVNDGYGIEGELGGVDETEKQLPQQKFNTLNRTVQSMAGIWDLTMQGQEAYEIKEYYEESNSGVSVKNRSKNGILVQQDGVTCKLYKYFDYEKICSPEYNESKERKRALAEEPAKIFENLPIVLEQLVRTDKYDIQYVPCIKLSDAGCVLIIKNREITRFIQLIENKPQEEKPLTSKERTTKNILIGALLKELGITPPYKASAPVIKLIVEKYGKTIADNTVRATLQELAEHID